MQKVISIFLIKLFINNSTPTRIRFAIFVYSFLYLLLPSNMVTFASDMPISEKVVRVSCPLQSGFFEVDENGDYSGYSYEYLMKIAQRTGWKYEFDVYEATNDNLTAAMERLKNGENDLLSGMVYSEELAAEYEYSTVPYGTSFFILVTNADNETINERTYKNIPNLRVALNEAAVVSNNLFNKYCTEEGVSYEAIYAVNSKEKVQLVDDGKADAFLSKDVVVNEGYKTLATFANEPFYFASAKGNTDIINKISKAIEDINHSDPTYAETLHKKYFDFEPSYQFSFTSEELDYMKHSPSIRVAVVKNCSPVSNYDSKTDNYSGILVDILKKLFKESQMNIEFIAADDMEHANQLMAEGKADALLGLTYDYSLAEKYNVLLTSPVFTMPVVRINNIQAQEWITLRSSIPALYHLKVIKKSFIWMK